MNILDELNAGKKLRRKSWMQHKNQETLYISKVKTDGGYVVALWTNNGCFSKYSAIAISTDGYWAVAYITLSREIFEDDWEVIDERD